MRLWLQKKTRHCMSAMGEASWSQWHVIWADFIKPAHSIMDHPIQFRMLKLKTQRESSWLRGEFPRSSYLSCHPLCCSWVIKAVENSRACCGVGHRVGHTKWTLVPSLLWKTHNAMSLLWLEYYCGENKLKNNMVVSWLLPFITCLYFTTCLCVLIWWLWCGNCFQLGKLATDSQQKTHITTLLFPSTLKAPHMGFLV